MPSLDDLDLVVKGIDPTRTALFIGSGGVVESGGPTASELCEYLERTLAKGESISRDLAELASILERRVSRKVLVETVAKRLEGLRPDTTLVSLMSFSWAGVYTTNYDMLIELALGRANRPYVAIRSNADWDDAHKIGVTKVFKIHGCLSQDRSKGHNASMILSSEDYDDTERYRELLYNRLQADMSGGSVVFLGHSLRDDDVRLALRTATDLQRRSGAPGKIHLLMHEIDGERADIWRAKGVRTVSQGNVGALVRGLESRSTTRASITVKVADGIEMPPSLAVNTIVVRDARGESDARRMYYGGSAMYPDIRAELTFPRDQERNCNVLEALVTCVIGAAGTGKTTLARRLLVSHERDEHVLLLEHKTPLAFSAEEWIKFEAHLRERGQSAVLLLDNCPPYQRQVNQLLRGLPSEGCALHLVVTAETSAWKMRQKDRRFYSEGVTISLSRLSDFELRRLLDLVSSVPEMRGLIDGEFSRLSDQERMRALRNRCRADMFVCLKALFSTEQLDDILLREYTEIEEPYRDIYRITCALESAGAIPHRQMILRLCDLPGQDVPAALDVLDGLVVEDSESDTRELGVFLWRIRHEVIARIITKYKYSDPEERLALYRRVIDEANPSYFIEARSLRDMCNSEMGIRSLESAEDRIHLYRLVINAMPRERVARHRLVRELIDADRLADAEGEIRTSLNEVGLDPPLQRYRTLIGLRRSQKSGLLSEDRRAIVRQAMIEAKYGVSRFADNKYMYFTLADVAEEWFRVTDDREPVEDALSVLRNAFERLLDPDLTERMRRLESI